MIAWIHVLCMVVDVLPLLSLHPENMSAGNTFCCSCRVPGAQVLGPDALLALGGETVQVCCWWVFMAARGAAFKELVWTMFGDPELSRPRANNKWYVSLKDKTSLTLGVVAWCVPCSFRGSMFLMAILLGLWGPGAIHLHQSLTFPG